MKLQVNLELTTSNLRESNRVLRNLREAGFVVTAALAVDENGERCAHFDGNTLLDAANAPFGFVEIIPYSREDK